MPSKFEQFAVEKADLFQIYCKIFKTVKDYLKLDCGYVRSKTVGIHTTRNNNTFILYMILKSSEFYLRVTGPKYSKSGIPPFVLQDTNIVIIKYIA